MLAQSIARDILSPLTASHDHGEIDCCNADIAMLDNFQTSTTTGKEYECNQAATQDEGALTNIHEIYEPIRPLTVWAPPAIFNRKLRCKSQVAKDVSGA